MFKPLARLLGNKQNNNNKTQKTNQNPTNQSNKTEWRVKTTMIVKIDFPAEIKNSEQH